MFWCFWWACGPCGLLASLGRSWVLGVLLGRVLVLRKCIPNASMLQVCLAAHHIETGASAHALVDERNPLITVGMGCTIRARQASPGRPQTVLSVIIQFSQPPSRQQRANHWVRLSLHLQQQSIHVHLLPQFHPGLQQARSPNGRPFLLAQSAIHRDRLVCQHSKSWRTTTTVQPPNSLFRPLLPKQIKIRICALRQPQQQPDRLPPPHRHQLF